MKELNKFNKANFEEHEYNQVKALQAAGVSLSQAKKVMLYSRSSGTWDKVRTSKDWAAYKARNEEFRLAQLAKVRKPVTTTNGRTEVVNADSSLLSKIEKLQISIDVLSAKIDGLGSNERTLLEKVLGKLQ